MKIPAVVLPMSFFHGGKFEVGKVEASVGRGCCHVGLRVSGSGGETEEAAAEGRQWPGWKEQRHASGRRC